VTVKDARCVSGMLGGHSANRWKRKVLTHRELLSHLRYAVLMTLFCLGSGPDLIVIRQLLGAAMGGRLSKVLVSILSGEGESRFMNIQQLWEYHGYGVLGLEPWQVFSMLRLMDDGCIAATCHCSSCIDHLLGLMWGPSMRVTTEEEGHTIKVGDAFERYINGRFYLFALYPDSPHSPPLVPTKVRHVPFQYQPRPIGYARTLFLGALHRAHQLRGNNHNEFLRALWEKAHLLHAEPLAYPWPVLKKSLLGIKLEWATRAIQRVRITMELLEHSDCDEGLS
jgi:hypothetical protein